MERMKLYLIYWYDGSGNKDLLATTNNTDKWLVDNNKECEEGYEETLDDFHIEERSAYIYSKEK